MNIISRIRSAENGLFTKGLLLVLTLALSLFGLAGIGFLGGSGNVALKVAGESISIVEVDRALKQQIAYVQSRMKGITFDYAQAVRMGFLDQVVGNIVWIRLLDAEASRTGILYSERDVVDQVKKHKDFTDDKGNFSPEIFARVLELGGETEANYIRQIGLDMTRRLLMGTIAGGVSPSYLANVEARLAAGTRMLDVAILNPASEKAADKPSEDDLKSLYESERTRFMEPERRALSLITVTPAVARPGEDRYKAMLEVAENIIDEKNGGAATDVVARAFKVDVKTLPPMTADGRDPAISPRLRDIGFFRGEGDISEPEDLPGSENLALVVVEKVYPAAPKPFDAVRADLERLWLANRQSELAAAKADLLLGKVSAGTRFAEAVVAFAPDSAFKMNLVLGAEAKTLPPDVVARAFSAAKDRPFIAASGGSFYVVSVKSAAMPPADPSKDQLSRADDALRALLLESQSAYLASRFGVKRYASVLARFGSD